MQDCLIIFIHNIQVFWIFHKICVIHTVIIILTAGFKNTYCVQSDTLGKASECAPQIPALTTNRSQLEIDMKQIILTESRVFAVDVRKD